jgi:hypothetical protein
MPTLTAGPVVGHTTESSTRVWICTDRDPSEMALRIGGRLFGFAPTDPTQSVGTALAIADKLRPDLEYHYAVLWRGLIVGRGSVRTMPPPGSYADMPFLVGSCSDPTKIGVWPLLRDTVKRLKPRFLLLIGDQVYENEPWDRELRRDFRNRAERIASLVDVYVRSWARTEVAEVLANLPTYMMWDDHEVRDGWGSWASDSPTLAAKYPQAAKTIFPRVNSYFEDARHVAWNFQLAHNPPEIKQGPGEQPWRLPDPQPNTRDAYPFVFEAGRLAVVAVDSRGNRDYFRDNTPVLGDDQWRVLDKYVAQLSPNIDALVMVTPTPIVAMDPDGLVQQLLGDRDDDAELFKQGSYNALMHFQEKGGSPSLETHTPQAPLTAAFFPASTRSAVAFGRQFAMQENNIDDARDQWTNPRSLPECERLIRLVLTARTANRLPSAPRAVAFVGGDVHVGARYDIAVDDLTIPTLISSGISMKAGFAPIGIYLDPEFDVVSGISAKLVEYQPSYNFGYCDVIFGATTPQINLALSAKESGSTLTLELQ